MKIIAKIHTDFPSKFGIPRQSGLVNETEGIIIFEPQYRVKEALRGIEQWSHLWLLWEFSENKRDDWSPTVRPPRLGGNERVGVFATRSPFRPNPIGLSCVKFIAVEELHGKGTVLRVAGADMMDNTPIFDIKPYIPITDCHTDAYGGFSDERAAYCLEVEIPNDVKNAFPENKLTALKAILSQDPRPAYQNDCDRIYGFEFAGHEIKFRVSDGVVCVISAMPIDGQGKDE